MYILKLARSICEFFLNFVWKSFTFHGYEVLEHKNFFFSSSSSSSLFTIKVKQVYRIVVFETEAREWKFQRVSKTHDPSIWSSKIQRKKSHSSFSGRKITLIRRRFALNFWKKNYFSFCTRKTDLHFESSTQPAVFLFMQCFTLATLQVVSKTLPNLWTKQNSSVRTSAINNSPRGDK